jgi:hypothetical protein
LNYFSQKFKEDLERAKRKNMLKKKKELLKQKEENKRKAQYLAMMMQDKNRSR